MVSFAKKDVDGYPFIFNTSTGNDYNYNNYNKFIEAKTVFNFIIKQTTTTIIQLYNCIINITLSYIIFSVF